MDEVAVTVPLYDNLFVIMYYLKIDGSHSRRQNGLSQISKYFRLKRFLYALWDRPYNYKSFRFYESNDSTVCMKNTTHMVTLAKTKKMMLVSMGLASFWRLQWSNAPLSKKILYFMS